MDILLRKSKVKYLTGSEKYRKKKCPGVYTTPPDKIFFGLQMVVFAWKLGKNYFLILKVKYLTKVEIWRTTIYYTPHFSPTFPTLPKFFLPNFSCPTNRPILLPTYYHTYILPIFCLLGCTLLETYPLSFSSR